ncbi:M48 family metallopeptidase [Luteimonas sp. SJ-92]|uniref:Putative beta-barrel assembly-enhancing protease n=1 Tax=Luteimonas salinisoli TaxID=2752307 RepID=A0A853JAW9_9GAMM|nr:M48 family metalloprotease [Luteimonas salinisoli]NZA26351.1 M48 family metallopeptidase [Luteimonas salinisoli]
MRSFLVALVLCLAVAGGHAAAQDNRLPDIGSSAGTVLSPARQAEYGEMLLAQLRHYDMVMEDPLVDQWLRSTGNRLASASDQPRQSFTFFMMKDRSINAFATLGGYIGLNVGLVLTAQSEDEVAAVLAHEIAHVTQNHVLRGAERAQRDSIPLLLAMLGAIAIASSSDSSSSGDAAMAAVASAQGLAMQRQIDYTRSNESEADRLGMRTLARSGFDVDGMADMFERMQAASRTNQGGERERIPDYLRTHPVTTTRIGEARQRAEQLRGNDSVLATTATPEAILTERVPLPGGSTAAAAAAAAGTFNPLLPGSLRVTTTGLGYGDSVQFGWARERMRVLSASTTGAAVREYEGMRRSGDFDDAKRYGMALARLQAGEAAAAASQFAALLEDYPEDTWLSLGLAEAEARSGRQRDADARFEALLRRMPNHRAVALTYAGVLAERNTPESGRRAQELLRPMLRSASDDPLFQRTFARISEIAGDPVRAGEAYAEADFLSGRAERALVQLNTLRKRDDLDYYARARIDARIAAITPTVLELRRQGVRDEDLRRRR